MMEARCAAYCFGCVQASAHYRCNVCKHYFRATRVEETLKVHCPTYANTCKWRWICRRIPCPQHRKQQQQNLKSSRHKTSCLSHLKKRNSLFDPSDTAQATVHNTRPVLMESSKSLSAASKSQYSAIMVSTVDTNRKPGQS